MSGFQQSNVAKWNFWAIGLVLASASALLRFWALSQTPFANGWDSYFYLVQLKSLEETGRMHSPEASLIYPYLRLFYRLTGDYVLALKTGTAVLCGLWTWVVWWFVNPTPDPSPTGRGDVKRSVENADDIAMSSTSPLSVGEGPGVGLNGGTLAVAAWSLFSPHLSYFAAQYPKNLMGLVLLVAFIASLSRLRLSMFSKHGKSWMPPVFLLTLNYFAHRFTFVLAVIYLAFWLIVRVKNLFFKKVFSTKKLLRAGVVLALFLVASQIFPSLFHIADFGRLKGVFTWPPQFAPWSFVSQFGSERISGWWLTEVILITGCWLLVISYWLLVISNRFTVRSKRPTPQSLIPNPHSQIPLLWLCTLLLFPFLEWSFTGVAWRFFLVFILLTPLLVIDFQFGKRRRSGLVFAAISLFCAAFSWNSYDPKTHDPDYARFATITERAQGVLKEQKIELVIAHNALAEFYTFTTGTDAMPWLPEYAVDSSRLWRIAAGVHLQTLRYFAGEHGGASITALGYQYFLLPEHVWQAAIERAKMENDEVFLAETLDWKNPSQRRPDWLLRRKRGY